MKVSLRKQLSEGIDRLGLEVEELAVDQILDFVSLLLKWNKVYNLTAITDPTEIITKHILDSMSVSPFLVGKSILDVGTGGGFPGIPLSLLNTKTKFTLLDSSQKRQAFLQHAKDSLKIPNISLACSRIESYEPDTPYDCIISRAFSSLSDFLEKSHHLIADSTTVLAMKGRLDDGELKEIGADFQLESVYDLKVPGLLASRKLVKLSKKQNKKG